MFSQAAIDAALKHMSEIEKAEEAIQLLNRLSTFGGDDFPEGTVLRWNKTFNNNPKVYIYAAVKGGALTPTFGDKRCWYRTGDNKAWTWLDLITFLVTEGSEVKSEDLEIVFPEGFEPGEGFEPSDRTVPAADLVAN